MYIFSIETLLINIRLRGRYAEEKYEDTKIVIRGRNSKNGQTIQWQQDKTIMVHKTLYR